MGFNFSKLAKSTLREHVSGSKKVWTWKEYVAVAKGAGYEQVKPKAGSHRVFVLRFEELGLDPKKIPKALVNEVLTRHPAEPHGKRKEMVSVVVTELMDALIIVNGILPEEERADADTIPVGLPSSGAVGRIQQGFRRQKR